MYIYIYRNLYLLNYISMSANYKINIIYSIESLYVVYIHKYAHINNYNRNLIIYNIDIMNNTNINI